jgi:hypothetical protein
MEISTTNIEILIARLDRELRSIHQDLSLVTKTGKAATRQELLLAEYLELTQTEGIIPAIQYIVLDGLTRHFNLDADEQQRQQLLVAMAEELEISIESDILVSIQIVQYTYPSIYQISQEPLELTQNRALEHLTNLPVPESPPSTYAIQHISKEVIIETKKNNGIVDSSMFRGAVRISIASSKESDKYNIAKNILTKLMIAVKVTIQFLTKVAASIIHATIVGVVLAFSMIFEALMGAINRN